MCCSGFGNLPSGKGSPVICLTLFCLLWPTLEDKTRGGPVSFLEKMLTDLNVVLARFTSSLCIKIRAFLLMFY